MHGFRRFRRLVVPPISPGLDDRKVPGAGEFEHLIQLGAALCCVRCKRRLREFLFEIFKNIGGLVDDDPIVNQRWNKPLRVDGEVLFGQVFLRA